MQTQDTTAHTFTTIAVADILDALCDAVDAARASTAPAPWQRAIDAAWSWLLEQDEIAYDLTTYALRVESASEAGKFYTANGACQCRAYTHGTSGACWHRAAARLVRRALELHNLAAELIADAAASGEGWYDAPVARVGARQRLPELEQIAREWDAAADLGGRLATARARVIAQAA